MLRRSPLIRSALVAALLLAASANLRAADPAFPRGQVESLRFTSDHGVLCENTTDVLSAGRRYPLPVWRRSSPATVPVTHSGSCPLRVDVTLSLSGVPADTAFRLEGQSPEPALCFQQGGRVPETANFAVSVESKTPPGPRVRTIRQAIRWTLTLHPDTAAARTIDLGTTGPHVIYVLLGPPRVTEDSRTVPTDIRVQSAIDRVAAAQAQIGDRASPPWLVYELMRQCGSAYVPARHYPRERAWQVPESWRMSPPGASCLSIVEFVRLVCGTIGLEGEVQPTAFFARADAPLQAIPGGLGDPPVRKTGPGGETWQLLLTDENNTRKGQVGGVGGMNYYEAALALTWKGKTYYYPAGTDRVYDSPDMVLRIFRTLAWAAYDDRLDAWVVREVVHTYTPPGVKQPESVPLPR